MSVTNTYQSVNRGRKSALSSLLGAVALTALANAPVHAADSSDQPMEKCYGVAAAGKNDCAAGSHSCAGQATKDHDKSSFVLVPAGTCEKLAGGSTKPMKNMSK